MFDGLCYDLVILLVVGMVRHNVIGILSHTHTACNLSPPTVKVALLKPNLWPVNSNGVGVTGALLYEERGGGGHDSGSLCVPFVEAE